MFKRLATQAGVSDRYEVDSAGTGAWHVGESPDSRMRRVAAERGLIYNGRARQFNYKDFDHFEFIIAMDQENRANLLFQARSQKEKDQIHLMREFDPRGGNDSEVPDPYYGGHRGFEEAFDIVERSCRGLLTFLEQNAGTKDQ
jgi:protein-tyrosine phosphatase